MSWSDIFGFLSIVVIVVGVGFLGSIYGQVSAAETHRVIATSHLAACVGAMEEAQLDPLQYCRTEFKEVWRSR